MLRSLFTGISGMRANQTMMDTVGNNIANVNTTGFKSSNTVFQDTLSQAHPELVRAHRHHRRPQPRTGRPRRPRRGHHHQLHPGRRADHRPRQRRDDPGRRLPRGEERRPDHLHPQRVARFDALGRLVGPSGGIVQGWTADATGTVDNNTPTGNITVPLGSTLAPNATTLASCRATCRPTPR
ncbi:hypothetical protein GCM10025868_41590 [Angustibacter aerolatus]|uniref:Flagellar basal body rod protein N-terminal domain-containing protein n=1 Tax=Angustibacter aerolatus TaxID=1162965 RepID=A0ABQ6JP50_9ACTN|nr:flagellar basal body protein [Angustibacter aerolatus]GMA88909.1 hypothetical protein GCM10025868_41590 [Angustibacter aerolatus]